MNVNFQLSGVLDPPSAPPASIAASFNAVVNESNLLTIGANSFTISGNSALMFVGSGVFDEATGEIQLELGLFVPATGQPYLLILTTGTDGALTGSPLVDGEATLVDDSNDAIISALIVVVSPEGPETGSGDGSGDFGSGDGSGDDIDDTLATIGGFAGITGSVELERTIEANGSLGLSGFVVSPIRLLPDGNPISTGDSDDPAARPVRRRVVIVDSFGNPVVQGFLADATQGSITWTRSQPTSFSVTLPLHSESAQMLLGDGSDSGIDTPFREAQLWRGDQLLTWGPIHSMSVNGDVLELAIDGDLTQGATGWYGSIQRGWGNPPEQNSPDTNIDRVRLPGDPTTWAFRLEDRVPLYQEPDQAEFTITAAGTTPVFVTAQTFFTVPPQPVGTRMTFSCWIQVEEFISRNDDGSSLSIGLFPPNARGLEDLIAIESASFPDDVFPGQKFRAEVSIDIPANQPVWGVGSVRSCKGVSYAWDFWLEWDGGLAYVNQDKASIMTDLVHHLSGSGDGSAQATGYPLRPFHGPSNYGKSDVRIEPAVGRSGYNLTRIYSFSAGGGDGIGALTDLAEDDANSGWKMLFSHERRWWHTMRNVGVRWDCPMRWLPSGGNLSSFGWRFMGEQAANVVNVFSAYPGSRAQGTAIDPSAFGGLTLEDSLSAVEDTWDEDLQAWADTHLFGTTRPVSLGLKLPAHPYATGRGLGVGQVVPVTIVHGPLKIAGFYRIHSMTLTEDDFLELTVTPARVPGVMPV
jgi:hypothetical protein